MRKKTIEYSKPIMRSDNKRIAKCGRFTQAHCYNYRHIDERCKGCNLVVGCGRKTKYFIINGKKYAKCIICGKIKPISRFYMNKRVETNRFGVSKVYIVYNYRCKKCTSSSSAQYMKNKAKKENITT